MLPAREPQRTRDALRRAQYSTGAPGRVVAHHVEHSRASLAGTCREKRRMHGWSAQVRSASIMPACPASLGAVDGGRSTTRVGRAGDGDTAPRGTAEYSLPSTPSTRQSRVRFPFILGPPGCRGLRSALCRAWATALWALVSCPVLQSQATPRAYAERCLHGRWRSLCCWLSPRRRRPASPHVHPGGALRVPSAHGGSCLPVWSD
jgi:hypothetical protein